ncbi:M48 family metalloprotease [Paenibacillus bouchesdurhonensis]|uniref:M48 family metalloprotease n=1 Tax=Paenibacillus bouchesdurhonensis TaxID=1870990 RepID=UPI000DA6141C|nr:M48 family metalloprotease [Paenibacillus bouchesdurhonensis]
MIAAKIILSILIYLLNAVIAVVLGNSAINKYKRTASREQALYFFGQIRSIHYIYYIVSMVVIIMLLTSLLPKTKANYALISSLPFAYLILSTVLSQLIYHRVYRIVRDIGTSLREELETAIKSSLMMYLPALIILPLRFQWITIELSGLWSSLLILIAVAAYNLAYPYLLRFSLSAKPLQDEAKKAEIERFLNSHSMKRVQVFEWPTTNNKVANAIVCGLIYKRVFIGSYLLENLSISEMNSILAHEIGHIRRFHLWIKAILFVAAIPLFLGLTSMMDRVEGSGFHIPIPVGVVFILALILGYLWFVGSYVSRKLERDADAYVLKMGIPAAVFVSALTKLAELNHSMLSIHKFIEKLQTHPSFEHRIQWIQHAAKHAYNADKRTISK